MKPAMNNLDQYNMKQANIHFNDRRGVIIHINKHLKYEVIRLHRFNGEFVKYFNFNYCACWK